MQRATQPHDAQGARPASAAHVQVPPWTTLPTTSQSLFATSAMTATPGNPAPFQPRVTSAAPSIAPQPPVPSAPAPENVSSSNSGRPAATTATDAAFRHSVQHAGDGHAPRDPPAAVSASAEGQDVHNSQSNTAPHVLTLTTQASQPQNYPSQRPPPINSICRRISFSTPPPLPVLSQVPLARSYTAHNAQFSRASPGPSATGANGAGVRAAGPPARRVVAGGSNYQSYTQAQPHTSSMPLSQALNSLISLPANAYSRSLSLVAPPLPPGPSIPSTSMNPSYSLYNSEQPGLGVRNLHLGPSQREPRSAQPVPQLPTGIGSSYSQALQAVPPASTAALPFSYAAPAAIHPQHITRSLPFEAPPTNQFFGISQLSRDLMNPQRRRPGPQHLDGRVRAADAVAAITAGASGQDAPLGFRREEHAPAAPGFAQELRSLPNGLPARLPNITTHELFPPPQMSNPFPVFPPASSQEHFAAPPASSSAHAGYAQHSAPLFHPGSYDAGPAHRTRRPYTLAAADAPRPGPSRAGPSRAGPSRAGPSRAGPSRAGPSRPPVVVGNHNQTVIHDPGFLSMRMEALEAQVRTNPLLARLNALTQAQVQRMPGLASAIWNGENHGIDIRCRYPTGPEEIDGLLDDASSLSQAFYMAIRGGMEAGLEEIKCNAVMTEEELLRRLARQRAFRPIPVAEVERRVRYVSQKFTKVRHAFIEKFKNFIRNLKWVEISPGRVRRGSLNKEQNHVLRLWFFRNFDNPYPGTADKETLCIKTDLTLAQVNNWFINARVRIWKPCINSMRVTRAARDTVKDIDADKERRGLQGPPENTHGLGIPISGNPIIQQLQLLPPPEQQDALNQTAPQQMQTEEPQPMHGHGHQWGL